MEKSHDKKLKKITRRMQTKLVILFLLIVLALLGLCVRLSYISLTNGAQYSKQILSQQKYETKTIPYQRGNIVDRNGIVLATSIKVYNLILDPKIIRSDGGKYLEPTVAALCNCFGFDESEIRNIIANNANSSYYRYKKGMTYDEIEQFLELSKGNVSPAPLWFTNSDGVAYSYYYIQGVWFEEEYKRIYPYNSLACDIIGFTNSGNVGSWGIEEYYNDTLNGVNGRKYGYLNADSDVESVVQVAIDGNTIVSTIDTNIQRIVEKKIQEFQDTTGSSNTAVVVMNPNNCEIYAMANSTFYDLNNPRDLSAFFTEEEIEAMSDDEKLKFYYSLWRNSCISDTYEPGSTAKIFTVAAALEENIAKSDTTFMCKGKLHVGGWDIHCHNKYGHKKLTLKESVMYSCNVAMMELAAEMGANNFVKYQENFGVGSLTGIDLPGEASAEGLYYAADKMKASDLATSSFGQNYNVTMIQMAAAYASVINGGYYYEPHIAKRIVNAEGNTVKEIEPILVKQTISNSTSKLLVDYLESTVTDGTGKNAAIEGYSIGGKTGTAEKAIKDKENYLVSFIGFSPVEKPEVLIYVIVDEPNVEKQSNSTYASGLARDILAEILPSLGVHSSIEPEPEPEPGSDIGTDAEQEPSTPEEPTEPESAEPSYSEEWEEPIVQEPESTEEPTA